MDTDEQLITAVAVLPGNAQDHERALDLVEQSEAATGCAVAETRPTGPTGTGRRARPSPTRGGARRQGGGRGGIGQLPRAPSCSTSQPALRVPRQAADRRPAAAERGGALFHFAAATCAACPLRVQCVKGSGGRTVGPPGGRAAAGGAGAPGQPGRRANGVRRQAVEHRIARLVYSGSARPATSGGPRRCSHCCWRRRSPT